MDTRTEPEIADTGSRMRLAVGLMSGTSMDGIDAALLTGDGKRIDALGPSLTLPYRPRLRRRLAGLVAAGERADPAAVAAVEAELTDGHGEAVERLLTEAGVDRAAVAVVGFPGHTLYHRPDPARRPGVGKTRQIGDATRLARLTRLPVVGDFRSADVAAGGEGAPLAPVFHAALAETVAERPLAVLNIGGVANITVIDGDSGGGTAALSAFDTGPGNGPLDDWVAETTDETCDRDGRLSAAGTADAARVAAALADHYYTRRPPKSLDRQDFTAAAAAGLAPADGARTLVEIVAASVAAAMPHLVRRPSRWLVTGGGRLNPTILAALTVRLGAPVEPIEAIGWSGDAVEAQAFAHMALRHLAGLPISFPGTTGVPAPLPGGRLNAPPDP